jgi:hypothetical protein
MHLYDDIMCGVQILAQSLYLYDDVVCVVKILAQSVPSLLQLVYTQVIAGGLHLLDKKRTVMMITVLEETYLRILRAR